MTAITRTGGLDAFKQHHKVRLARLVGERLRKAAPAVQKHALVMLRRDLRDLGILESDLDVGAPPPPVHPNVERAPRPDRDLLGRFRGFFN